MNLATKLINTSRTHLIKLVCSMAFALSPCVAIASDPGFIQWSFNYHNTEVPVAIWHPTEGVEQQIEAGPFTLQSVPEVKMEQQEHPLLLISHGTGGSNIAHHPIAEALASAGFLVAALTHPGDNFQDRSLIADERYFDERPRQLRALASAMTKDKKLGALIDPERIGAIGHSAGGYTVAALIGAAPDRQGLLKHCAEVTDDPACGYKDPSIGIMMPSSDPFVLATDQVKHPSANLSLIRSAVLLAPLGSVISHASHVDSSVPVLVITAEHDDILPAKYHLNRIRQVASHAESRIAKGAGHFSFIAPVNDTWREQMAEVAIDPVGFNRTAFNVSLGHDLVDWFTKTLAP